MKKISSKEAGYYSCKASNTFGTANTEMNLQMIPAITPDTIDVYDDITVYHDDTVVSGDISDAEFYQSMVKSFNIHTNLCQAIFAAKQNQKESCWRAKHISTYHSSRAHFIF